MCRAALARFYVLAKDSSLQCDPGMRTTTIFLIIAAAVAIASTWTRTAFAHCDTLDGPVAKAGLKALDSGELDHALVWVKANAEPELRAAFKQALAVRVLGKDARVLADRYFLETLVRLHRAGEGEPFTGLKPGGTDIGPAIPAADDAIRTGSSKALTKLITDAAADGVQHRMKRVIATRQFKSKDIAAGREYVEAYVAFMHYVERLYADASGIANTEHEPSMHRD